jgi:dUTP pyrophosphatase
MKEKEMDPLEDIGFDIDDEQMDYETIIDEFGIDIKEIMDNLDTYSPTMDLKYTNESPEVVGEPEYAYITDSGFDLRSTEELVIKAGERALVGTGLSFDIPDGYEIQVRSKSGLALKQGLMVLNSPGTIDFGYISEVKVILFNTSKEDVVITMGQKIAQAVLCPVVSGKWINLVKVDKIDDKDRNNNGFGSTGLI